MSRWYENEGKNSDVVLFSRIRLARNLADSPFPSRMSDDIRKSVTKKLYATLKSSRFANEFELINLADCTSEKAIILTRRRYNGEKDHFQEGVRHGF